MISMTVNGKTINVPSGRSVSVINGVVIVDGVRYGEQDFGKDILEIKVTEGTIENLTSDRSITCLNVSGNIIAKGSVTCGNIGGNVDSTGSVTCDRINGSVRANGSVVCDNVGGDVTAGGSITADNIYGRKR